MIVFITAPEDVHAQAVSTAMKMIGETPIILNLARFPQHMTMDMCYDKNQQGFRLMDDSGGEFDFNAIHAIWWRRPQYFQLHPEIAEQPAYQGFTYNECTEAFSGLWQSVDAFWVNHPTRDEVAGRKALQLKVAHQLGFEIPETLISNNPEQARQFIEAHGVGHTIYKPFSATEQAWRETRLLRDKELNVLSSVQYAPVIFQEYIEAQYDLRITIVGDQIFAAAIHSQETRYTVDFRMDIDHARITPIELPSNVQAAILRLMRYFGLIYGAVDMRLTPDGRYVFLEINPAGQWLFVEEATKQPISMALAQVLVENNKIKSVEHSRE